MSETDSQSATLSPRRLAVAFAVATAALWLLHEVASMLLLVAGMAIVAVMINAPVSWLTSKGWRRGAATAAVMVTIAGIIAGVVWLIIPRIGEQASELASNLPGLISGLRRNLAPVLSSIPGMQDAGASAVGSEELIGSLPPLLGRIGQMSLSFVGGLLMLVIFITTVVYIVLEPRPILTAYLRAFPGRHRDAAERAFSRGSESVIGYIWANVVIGGAEAILTSIVLSLLGVPGAIIWGVLTFFAELVPKVGGYIMAIPPVLAALAVEPIMALWTALYFVVLQIVAGDIVAPKLRASSMQVHPAFLVVVMLVLAGAFGLVGAILATPIAGYISAYYDEFIVARQPPDDTIDGRVDRMASMRGDR